MKWGNSLVNRSKPKRPCERRPKGPLEYGFCNKSFWKDKPLTSWTLFQHICPHFWVGLLGAIANPPKSEDKYVEKVFNWSEVHLSEMTCYKIHTLVINTKWLIQTRFQKFWKLLHHAIACNNLTFFATFQLVFRYVSV